MVLFSSVLESADDVFVRIKYSHSESSPLPFSTSIYSFHLSIESMRSTLIGPAVVINNCYLSLSSCYVAIDDTRSYYSCFS